MEGSQYQYNYDQKSTNKDNQDQKWKGQSAYPHSEDYGQSSFNNQQTESNSKEKDHSDSIYTNKNARDSPKDDSKIISMSQGSNSGSHQQNKNLQNGNPKTDFSHHGYLLKDKSSKQDNPQYDPSEYKTHLHDYSDHQNQSKASQQNHSYHGGSQYGIHQHEYLQQANKPFNQGNSDFYPRSHIPNPHPKTKASSELGVMNPQASGPRLGFSQIGKPIAQGDQGIDEPELEGEGQEMAFNSTDRAWHNFMKQKAEKERAKMQEKEEILKQVKEEELRQKRAKEEKMREEKMKREEERMKLEKEREEKERKEREEQERIEKERERRRREERERIEKIERERRKREEREREERMEGLNADMEEFRDMESIGSRQRVVETELQKKKRIERERREREFWRRREQMIPKSKKEKEWWENQMRERKNKERQRDNWERKNGEKWEREEREESEREQERKRKEREEEENQRRLDSERKRQEERNFLLQNGITPQTDNYQVPTNPKNRNNIFGGGPRRAPQIVPLPFPKCSQEPRILKSHVPTEDSTGEGQMQKTMPQTLSHGGEMQEEPGPENQIPSFQIVAEAARNFTIPFQENDQAQILEIRGSINENPELIRNMLFYNMVIYGNPEGISTNVQEEPKEKAEKEEEEEAKIILERAYNLGGPDAIEGHDRCIICLIDFQPNEKVDMLCCGHYYHKLCIKTWLKHKDNCPYCNQNIYESHQKRFPPKMGIELPDGIDLDYIDNDNLSTYPFRDCQR